MTLPTGAERLPSLILFCGMTLGTVITASHFYRRETDADMAEFSRRIQARYADIGRVMRDTARSVKQLNATFSAFGDMRRDQFDSIARQLRADYPQITALAYHRELGHSQRDQFERSRADVLPGGTISILDEAQRRPAPARPFYRVIDYALPNKAVGLDGNSHPAGDDAYDRAAASRELAITAQHTLLSSNGAERGYRLLAAHYRTGPAGETRALAGYSVASIGAAALFGQMLSEEAAAPGRLDMAVYEGDQANPANLLFRYASPAENGWTLPCLLGCQPLRSSRTFDWGGRQWHVELSSPNGAAPGHAGSLGLLLVGLLASIAAAVYVRSQQENALRVKQLVDLRTSELNKLNQILMIDIGKRKKTADDLRASRESVRRLAEHNAQVKEDERKRIAREIHDDLGQNLLALRIDLSLMAEGGPANVTPGRVREALLHIDTSMAAMRAIINELRPAVLDLGLDAAVEWEVAKFHRRTGIIGELDLRIDDVDIHDGVSTALYRIVQESLTNITRHANAQRVQVRLWVEADWLFLSIADDGVGMTDDCRRKSKSFGLIGIAERVYALGGAYDMESEPGKGTRITIALPLVPPVRVEAA